MKERKERNELKRTVRKSNAERKSRCRGAAGSGEAEMQIKTWINSLQTQKFKFAPSHCTAIIYIENIQQQTHLFNNDDDDDDDGREKREKVTLSAKR